MAERPTCACHGEPKRWHKDARKAAGGYWVCVVKKREYEARYEKTEKGRTTKRRWKRVAHGYNVPLDAPALSPHESVRRAGIARGDQRLDDAIAQYEEELSKFKPPHQEAVCL